MQKKLLRSLINKNQRLAGGFRYYGIIYTLLIVAGACLCYQGFALFQQRGQFPGIGYSFDSAATALCVYVYLFLGVSLGKFIIRPAFLSYPDLFENKWYLYSKLGVNPGELTTKKILISSGFMIGSYTVGAGIFTCVLLLMRMQLITANYLIVFFYGLIALTLLIFVPLFLSSIFDSYGWYLLTLAVAVAASILILFFGGVFEAYDAAAFSASAERVFSLNGATPLLMWLGTIAVSVFGATVIPSGKARKYRDMIAYPDKVATKDANRTTGKAVYRDVKTVAAALPAAKPKRTAEQNLPVEEEVNSEAVMDDIPEEIISQESETEHMADVTSDETIEFNPDKITVGDDAVEDVLSDSLSDEDIINRLSEAAAGLSAVAEDSENILNEEPESDKTEEGPVAETNIAESETSVAEETEGNTNAVLDEMIEELLSDNTAGEAADDSTETAAEQDQDAAQIETISQEDVLKTVEASVAVEQPVLAAPEFISPADEAQESDNIAADQNKDFDLSGLDFAEPDVQTTLYSKDEAGDDWLDPNEASQLFDTAEGTSNEGSLIEDEPLEGQMSFDEIEPKKASAQPEEITGIDEKDLPKHPVLKTFSIISLVLGILGVIPSAISLIHSEGIFSAVYSLLATVSSDDNARLIVDTLRAPVGRYLFVGSTAILFAVYLGFRFLLADMRKRDIEDLEDDEE